MNATIRTTALRRECARSPWLPWSLSVLLTADPDACRSGINCSVAARQKLWTALHGPALPDMDFRSGASSNFSSNIVPESGRTDFVEGLVRLEAETAADDLLHDLGGAAKDRLDPAEPPEPTIASEIRGLLFPPVKAGLHLVSASRGVRAVPSGRRSRARGSSRRAAARRAAAWPRRRRRTSGRRYPSRRCGRRLR
jgi:hypothetical protein